MVGKTKKGIKSLWFGDFKSPFGFLGVKFGLLAEIPLFSLIMFWILGGKVWILVKRRGKAVMYNLRSELMNATEMTKQALTDKRSVSQRVMELMRERDGQLPVWIRSPKSGPEHYCGLSRAKLYELSGKGRIRSKSIREPGQIRGTRLFELASILSFIETQGEDVGMKEVPDAA